MFNTVSSFLSSVWEIAGSLPMALGGVGDEPEQKPPVVLAWEALPNIQTAGQWVPRDVIHLIFRKLPPDQLFKVRMVCRLWCQMAEQYLSLPRLFPDAPVLDRPVWERHVDLKTHGLVFEEGKAPPPLTVRQYIETEQMASGVEKGQRITILTLPKGLTLNKIIAFARAPKLGNSTEVNILSCIIEKYGDKEIEETVTVVVTNGVFNKSRNSSVEEQEALVKGLKCEMPKLVPFMAHIILSFMISGPDSPVRLFGPGTFTRFFEDVSGSNAVGGSFALDGPRVRIYGSIGGKSGGVGGLRKFPAIGH